MTLARKSPMKRSAFKTADRATGLRRTTLTKKAKKRPPKAEREHMGVVAGLCCVVCRNLGYGESPAEVHHVRFLAGGGQRAGNFDTIPLCPQHHRLGGFGVAIHAGKETWEAKYGTEADLLEQIQNETGIAQEVECVS